MSKFDIPTLFDWLGGMAALDHLTARFYERVKDNEVLAPLFAKMSDEHPRHVAVFLAEVLGGPAAYSDEHGGHPHMIGRHLGRHLSQTRRGEWVRLLLDTADEIGLPDDPEFRSALVGYLEWGSRLAVINSQPGVVWVVIRHSDFKFVPGRPNRFRSSPHVVRTFCGRCGTPLTYQHDDSLHTIDVTTATLDRPEQFPPPVRSGLNTSFLGNR